MSFNTLTAQGLRGTSQRLRLVPDSRATFNPFGSLGDVSDQALRNAVVDVVVNVGDANRVFFYDARLAQSLKDRLNNSGFRVISLDASNLGSFGGGGTIRVRAQVLSDGYATANDAASVIAGAAAALGYNATGSSGVVVQAGGSSGPGPQTGSTGQTYENPLATSGENPITTLWTSLTQSPISLAVVIGGAALLTLVVLKK